MQTFDDLMPTKGDYILYAVLAFVIAAAVMFQPPKGSFLRPIEAEGESERASEVVTPRYELSEPQKMPPLRLDRYLYQEEEKTPQKASKVPNSSTQSSGGNSFKRQGVIHYNGYSFTWYSSRVLRHYRTDEWSAGEDGIYRDDEGYVIVSSSDLSQGSTVDTPFGAGKVYDSGCPSGTIDVYTNF